MSSYQQRPLPPPPDDYYHEPAPPPKRRKKDNRVAKTIVTFLVIIILLTILIFSPLSQMLFSALFQNQYPAYSEISVTRTIDLSITGGTIEYEMDIPLPKDLYSSGFAVQEVHSTTTSPAADTIIKYGDQWALWSGTAANSESMSMTYVLTVHTKIWDISTENSGMQDDIPSSLVSQQTGNEWRDGAGWKIWPTHPDIVSLARSLTLTGATVLDNVESIYDYMVQDFDYRAGSGEPKDCLDTLADGYGDCDDQSILFCSLCRAVDIPAWLAFGALYDSGSDSWGGHGWAEVYIPLADGGDEEVTVDVVNKEFMIRNCNRIEEWKSDGNSEHLEDYYHHLTYHTTGVIPGLHVTIDETYSGTYSVSSETAGTRSGANIWIEESLALPAVKEETTP